MNGVFSSVVGLLPLALAGVASIETPDTSSSLAVWWILGLAGTAVILNNILDAWRKMTGNFKEREQPGPDYVQRADCKEMHKTMSEQWEETEQRHTDRTNELRKEIKGDISGVHKRIDEILKGVSRLEGKVSNE